MRILIAPKVIQRKGTRGLFAAWPIRPSMFDRIYKPHLTLIAVRPARQVCRPLWVTTGPENVEDIAEFVMRGTDA